MGVRFYRYSILISLLICLFIGLVTVVSAASTIEITGESGLTGIRAMDDITKVHGTSDAMLSIVREDRDYVMDCQETPEGGRVCDHTFAKSTLEAGEYSLKFKPIEPEGPEFLGKFIVDGMPPSISGLELKQEDDLLRIKFTLTDRSSQDIDDCSGVKSISITTESNSIFTDVITEPNKCSYTRDFTITPPRISGDINFSIVIDDYVGGRTTTSYQALDLDFKSPEILDDVSIMNGDTLLGIIAVNPVQVPIADVHFKIKDDDLETVFADVTALSRRDSLKALDSKRTANCVLEDAWWSCVVEKVEINPGSDRASINITATDTKGHESQKSLLLIFEVQTDASEIIYFGKSEDYCLDGVCYFKKGLNKVHLHITSQKELDPMLITISGSETSPAGPLNPELCNETGSYYDCVLNLPVEENTIPSQQETKVPLQHPSLDAFGLQLKGISLMKIKTDYELPEAQTDLNFSIDCPIVGEKAYFRVNVTDDSPVVRIKTRPQKITSKDYFVTACKNQGSVFECELEINGFVSYAQEEELEVIVEDIAGNELKFTHTVQVCQAEGDYPPETIGSIDASTKQQVDRRTMSFMTIKTYLPLDINFKNSATEIYDLDTNGCVGTTGLAGRPYFINKFSKQPVLVVPIGGGNQLFQDSSDVIINCTIKVYEKRGTTRYTQPEEEPLLIKLSTFNQELNTVDDATNKKLNDLKDQIQELDVSIEKMNKYLKVLDGICTATETFNKVFSTMAAVKTTIYGVAVGLEVSVGGGQSLWDAVTPIFDFVEKTRNTVWPIGKMGDWINLGDKAKVGVDNVMKLGCLIYNCGQCSVEGIMQGVNIVGSWKRQLDAIDTDEAMRGKKEKEPLINVEGVVGAVLDKTTGILIENAPEGAKDLYGKVIAGTKDIDTAIDEATTPEAKDFLSNIRSISDNEDIKTFSKDLGLSNTKAATAISSTATNINNEINKLDKTSKNYEKKYEKLTSELKDLGYSVKDGELEFNIKDLDLSKRDLNKLSKKVDSQLEIQISTELKYGMDPGALDGFTGEEINKKISVVDSDIATEIKEQERIDNEIQSIPIVVREAVDNGLSSFEEDIGTGMSGDGNKILSEDNWNNYVDEYKKLDAQLSNSITTKTNLETEKIQLQQVINNDYLGDEQTAFAERQRQLEANGNVKTIDPYETIGLANVCGCAPAILYGKEKLRQLKCREYKCIEQNAMNGLPITSCETDFDEGKCIYYTNPLTKQSFLDSFWEKIADNYFFGATDEGGWEGMDWRSADQGILLSRKILCYEDYLPIKAGKIGDFGLDNVEKGSLLITGWRSVYCALSGSYLTVRDYKAYWNKDGWYTPTLREVPGEDFCAGVDLNE